MVVFKHPSQGSGISVSKTYKFLTPKAPVSVRVVRKQIPFEPRGCGGLGRQKEKRRCFRATLTGFRLLSVKNMYAFDTESPHHCEGSSKTASVMDLAEAWFACLPLALLACLPAGVEMLPMLVSFCSFR